jgi:hypothetical protein
MQGDTRHLKRSVVNIMATQTTPTMATFDRLLDEVDEWSDRVRKVRRKLNRLPRGSDAYLDLLPDLEVDLTVLKSKAEHAHEALEEFEESLPDSN